MCLHILPRGGGTWGARWVRGRNNGGQQGGEGEGQGAARVVRRRDKGGVHE